MRYSSLFHTSFTFEGQQEGEKVLMLLHQHWIVIAVKLLALTLVMILLLAVIFGGAYPILSKNGLTPIPWFLAALSIAVWWASGFYMLMNYLLTTFIITNHRVIYSYQRSLFLRTVNANQFEKIQDITVLMQGILWTFLNIGSIQIQTAGTEGKFIIPYVGDPNGITLFISAVLKKNSSTI